jgi:hypothetical protein
MSQMAATFITNAVRVSTYMDLGGLESYSERTGSRFYSNTAKIA